MPKIVRFWCWSLKSVDPKTGAVDAGAGRSVPFGVQWSYRSSASQDDPFSYGYRGVAQIEYPFAGVLAGVHDLVLVRQVAQDALALAVAEVRIVVVHEMRAEASQDGHARSERPHRA